MTAPGAQAAPLAAGGAVLSPWESRAVPALHTTLPSRAATEEELTALYKRSNPAPPTRGGEQQFNTPETHNQDIEGQVRAGSVGKAASLLSCSLRERARGSSQHAEPTLQPELGTAQEEGAWRKQHASKRQQWSLPCQNLHKIISCKSSFCFKLDF